jgi:aminopeptidase N
MSDFLELTKNFPANADPILVATLSQQLTGLDFLYEGLPARPAYRAYARRILKPAFARVGWDPRPGESGNTVNLRSTLVSALNELADPEVVAQTRARFEKYLANPAGVSADTRRSLLANVAVQADAKLWDRLHQMAKSAKSELERQELYELLGASQDAALAQRALGLVFSPEIPPTYGPEIVGSVAGRHPQLALDFAIANWERLSKMLEVTSAFNYIPTLTFNNTDLKAIDKLNRFAERHVPENARMDYVVAIARIRYLAKVRETRLPEVDRWVAKMGSDPVSWQIGSDPISDWAADGQRRAERLLQRDQRRLGLDAERFEKIGPEGARAHGGRDVEDLGIAETLRLEPLDVGARHHVRTARDLARVRHHLGLGGGE